MSSAKKQQLDVKTQATIATIQRFRMTGKIHNEIAMAASAYSKQLLKLVEAERAFMDAVGRLGTHQAGDLGEGFMSVSSYVNLEFSKHEVLARSLQDDVANHILRTLKSDDGEMDQFESDYKKQRSITKANIEKAEALSKKAAKKGQAALQQSIADLGDRIKDGEQMKSDKLRQAILIERKKQCNLLNSLNIFACNSLSYHSEASTKVSSLADQTKGLALAAQKIPEKVEEVVASQTRTFVAVQGGGDSYGSDPYGSNDPYATNDPYGSGAGSSYSSGYDDYDYGGSSGGGYSAASSGNYGGSSYSSSGFGTATALYDYAGEASGDLPFYAGETITLTAADDGSGWLSGSLNGASGIFPASYVQIQ
eukprot:TRINITY_DN472_c0_g1_i1.p1 TRINITY_DN472_c0_g1~~TRINITY_DN472_c0_g1_i1.p1  ORF type:complete len:366 (+),score=148.56 TRINITY_DN472_c0_g1_i1:142-1239(+)